MRTREERLAEHFRLAAEQADARANGKPILPQRQANRTSPPRNVSIILRTRLQREFGVGCTSCFNATLAQLDKLSIAEIRLRTSEFANSIRENAHEMESVKRRTDGRKLIDWAKANGNGDSATAYERLIIEACDACSPLNASEVAVPTRPARLSFDGPISLQRTSDLEAATRNILRQVPANISGVAGVPRSGIFPASLLAMWLHVPLYEISPQHGLQTIGHGSRGRRIVVDRSSPVLVVDDSTYSGGTMSGIRSKMEGRSAIYSVAFATPDTVGSVDIVGTILPSPHLFTWNLFNNGIIAGHARNPALHGGMALDFDGVLCDDCERDGDDSIEGTERYRQWIVNAKPKWLPRLAEVPLIVTFRQERFRAETEQWLSKWGVKCKRLVMDQATTFDTRTFDVARHKGDTFRESACCLFIESDDMQASIIHRVSGKPVIVPDSGRVYQ